MGVHDATDRAVLEVRTFWVYGCVWVVDDCYGSRVLGACSFGGFCEG